MLEKLIGGSLLMAFVVLIMAAEMASHQLPGTVPDIPWASLWTGYGIAMGLVWGPFVVLVVLGYGLHTLLRRCAPEQSKSKG